MKRIGLTGGFGTGKTTVLGFFARRGALVASADEMAHEELRGNKCLREDIRRVFGDGVFVKGRLDARALAREAFASRRLAQKLNALVHPLVRRRVKAFLSRGSAGRRVCVVEVPLLFEAGFEDLFDATVVVAASPAAARRRVAGGKRFSSKDWRRRSALQWPLRKKIARGDFIIDNSGTRNRTYNQVKDLMDRWRV